MDNILSQRIALYQSSEQSKKPWGVLRLDQYFDWVKTGNTPQVEQTFGEYWQVNGGKRIMAGSAQTINKIRASTDKLEQRILKEGSLTGVTFGHCRPTFPSGVVIGRRHAKSSDSGTQLVCFDIDGIETADQAEHQRDRLFTAIPSLLAAGVSASGKGVWLVIAMSRAAVDKDDYAKLWWLLAVKLQNEHGVQIGVEGGTDRAPSNIVSLRFYSHDPHLRTRSKDTIELFNAPDPDDVPTVEESKVRAGVMTAVPARPRSQKQLQPSSKTATGKPAPTKEKPAPTPTPTPTKEKTPIYSERINWVASAGQQGASHHNRARSAIWLDVAEGQAPDDNRIDAYTDAIGRDDRNEVVRLVEGAVAKLADERKAKARGNSDKPSVLFPAPKTMPRAVSERQLGHNADDVLPVEKVLYVPEQKIWRIWDNNSWRDGTLELTSWMGTVGECTYGTYKEGKGGKTEFKHQPSTGGRYNTAVNAIKYLRSVVREKHQTSWDDNRRVLGLPDGKCLEITGDGAVVRQQLTHDYITQTLPFAPADDWRDGEFETFLNDVVPDEETRCYLQRHLGYGLVCDGSEPYFLWLRGAGRSGKSTLIRYVQSCVPQHFTTVVRDSLLLKASSRHLTTEAKLANKRYCYWAEARGDGYVDAEKIKGWTGGDEQTSHFMRQDMFDWTPRFLLIIVSNNNLQLSSPDDAFCERVRLVDCWTTIPRENRKTSVWRQARSGDPQCLRWLADGASDYVRAVNNSDGSGLLPETRQMRKDRDEWQFNADPVSKFVRECCRIVDKPTGSMECSSIRELHSRYESWAQELRDSGEDDRKPLLQPQFSYRLKQLPGVVHKKRRFGNLIQRGYNLVIEDQKFDDDL